MASDEDHFDALNLQFGDMRGQLLALRSVCAMLIAEIALRDPSPEETVTRLTEKMAGTADAVARNAPGPNIMDVAFTRATDGIKTMAEKEVARRMRRRR